MINLKDWINPTTITASFGIIFGIRKWLEKNPDLDTAIEQIEEQLKLETSDRRRIYLSKRLKALLFRRTTGIRCRYSHIVHFEKYFLDSLAGYSEDFVRAAACHLKWTGQKIEIVISPWKRRIHKFSMWFSQAAFFLLSAMSLIFFFDKQFLLGSLTIFAGLCHLTGMTIGETSVIRALMIEKDLKDTYPALYC